MTGNGAETLAERVEAVIAEMDEVAVVQSGDERELRAAGRLFAVISDDALEVVLDSAVAEAAQREPVDRAEAWLRSAHRGPSGRA